MHKYTVLLTTKTEPNAVATILCEALHPDDACYVAARELYAEQHIGWDTDALQDDPFDEDNYSVIAIYQGHHHNVAPY